MRLDTMGLNNVLVNDVCALPSLRLSEAMQLYLRLKGRSKAKTFQQAAIRNVSVVIDVIGDKPISEYTTILAIE